jgi:hypothetical protein
MPQDERAPVLVHDVEEQHRPCVRHDHSKIVHVGSRLDVDEPAIAHGWITAQSIDRKRQTHVLNATQPVPEPGAYGGSVLVMPVSPTAPDTRYWGFYHASHVYEGNDARRIARIDKVLSGRYLMAAIDVSPAWLTGDTDLMERVRAAASLVDVPIGFFEVRLPIVRLRQYVQEPVGNGR